jgi:PKD repeat protein
MKLQAKRTSWNGLFTVLVIAGMSVALLANAFRNHSSGFAASPSPVAILHVGSNQNVGYIFSVDGSESYGDGEDPFTAKDEIIDFMWDFGDGSNPESGEFLNTHTHTFSEPGIYTITLTVTDLNGASNSTSAIVNVGTLPLQSTLLWKH